MLRRVLGAFSVAVVAAASAFFFAPEPAIADGCGQECGTQYNQCIVSSGSFAFCEDWGIGSGDCRDWGPTTCGLE